jgi:hypothetical protein
LINFPDKLGSFEFERIQADDPPPVPILSMY